MVLGGAIVWAPGDLMELPNLGTLLSILPPSLKWIKEEEVTERSRMRKEPLASLSTLTIHQSHLLSWIFNRILLCFTSH